MKIVLASDHAGYAYKKEIKNFLKEKGVSVIDVGTNSIESCDYPIFAHEAAKKVAEGDADYGILVCSSGEGIAIAANKVKGVRAGIAYNDEVARLMRQHNNANIICAGARFASVEDICSWIKIFLETKFEERHLKRINKIREIEQKQK